MRAPPLPNGLRPRPWTGSPAEAAALTAVLRRTAGLPGGAVDEATATWFLRDRDLDVDETVAKLGRYMAWRDDVKPHKLTPADVAAEAATGKVYLHSRPDALGRPAVVVRCARHYTGARPLRSSIELAAYVLDAAVAALPPGTDTLVGIFDLRGFGPANADLAFARFLVDACFLYYPRRLGAVLFVDAPWAFKPVWLVVKPLLRKYGALVRFVGAEDVVAAFGAGDAPADFVGRK